jgi:predicted RNA binding protein YcfA (HicA-like mRNA interferase family)
MPKLRCVSGYKAARALERLGFERRRQRGSHLVMRRAAAVCVLPMHREVDQGTLRNVLRQAGVSEEQFLRALQRKKSNSYPGKTSY